ncbi:MAG TPA: recombinase family protein [Anaeromyxobacter sp.]
MTRATRHDAAAVVIYARYSTDRQDARSIDDQVRRCRVFAEARALQVVGVFQARFVERKGAKGRARGTGKTGHLLTGLLRCGECGSTMRVVSLKRKAGRACANFGCSAHHGKGAATCRNGLVISERKLNRAVIDELRKLLASKEIQARFVDGFTKRLQHKDPHDDRERAALEAEVTAQESRVRNVTAAIARSGFSEALAEQRGLEEETLRSLRQRLAAKLPAGDRSAAIPDPDAVARFLEKVLEIAETAPQRASGSLSRILVPITLVPVEGSQRNAALRSARSPEYESGRPLGRPGVR